MDNQSFKTILKVVVALTVAAFPSCVHAQTITDINKLSAKLLEGYNRNTLPSNNQSKVFKIGVSAMLLDLGELDEINEKLSTVMLFYLEWRDESMVWDVEEHNNITNITMDQESVWLPNLRLTNMHYETHAGRLEKDMEKVLYLSDGIAIFTQIKILHTACELDTTKYPFDKQTCNIEMYISGYNGYLFHMEVLMQDILLGVFDGDGAWDVINNTITGNNESEVVVTFVFKRKPLYTLLNVVLPIAALVFLTPTVFLLPNHTGERIGFAITTLLAISVYMTIVGSHLPAKSDPLPLLSILLFVWYLMTGVIVFIVILNVNIYARSAVLPVSATAERLVKFSRWFSRKSATAASGILASTSLLKGCSCCGSCIRITHADNKCSSGSSNTNGTPPTENTKGDVESAEYNGGNTGIESTASSSQQNRITWQNVSEAIDSVVMVAIYSVDVIVTLVYIIVMCVKDDAMPRETLLNRV